MKYRFRFLVLVVVAGVLSTLLHELGHCVAYWLQGIPAGMSLAKEYPLVDITARQYAIGSAGGPAMSILLILVIFVLARRFKKKTFMWSVLSAGILANAFYLIMRSLLALLKRRGGELGSAGGLVDLDYTVVAALFLVIAVVVLASWMRRYRIRHRFVTAPSACCCSPSISPPCWSSSRSTPGCSGTGFRRSG